MNCNFAGSYGRPAAALLRSSTAFLSAVRGRRDIRANELWVAMAGRIVGTLAATAVLWANPSREIFAIVFSVSLLVVVAVSATRPPIALTRRTLAIAGSFSGLLGTLIAVGALPMGLVYQGQAAASARATLNSFFAIGVLPSIVALIATGYLGTTQFLQALLLVPFVLAMLAGLSNTAHLVQMFDSTIVRGHVSAAGAKGGSRARLSAARAAASARKTT